jgi:hypothetical protein
MTDQDVQKIVKAFEDKDEDFIENILKKLAVKDDKIVYTDKSKKPHDIPVKDFDDAKKLITKMKEDSNPDTGYGAGGDYSDTFEKIGEVAVLRNVPKLVGRAQKPEELSNEINGANYDDVYDLAFEKDPNIAKGQFNGRTPYEVMEACARRQAVEELKKNNKIEEDKYKQLVTTKEDGKKEYSKDIASDAATKNKYLSIKNNLEKKFREGVVAARKKLDAGENLKEPFTNKELNLEDGEIKKALKGAAKNAAGKVGDILGISKNSPDIFSKLIFASLAGGNKLWKAFKQNQEIRKFNGKNTAAGTIVGAFKKIGQLIKSKNNNSYEEMKAANEEAFKQVEEYIKKNPEFKERAEKAQQFIEKMHHQAIPTAWALAAATGAQDDVQRVFEALEKQEELLELLTERSKSARKREKAWREQQAVAQQEKENPQEQPAQKQEEQPAENKQEETPAEETKTEETPAEETQTKEEPKEQQEEQSSGEEKIDELIANVSSLMKIDKVGEFESKYVEWAKTVNAVLQKAGESDKLKNAVAEISKKDDPFEKICLLKKACSETQKEPEQPQQQEESLEDDLILHNFFRRLDEKLK